MKLFLKIIFTCFLSFFLSASILAQQDPQYTQYMHNTMSVNPAYAGSKGHGVITAIGRTQWVGFDGAPNTQNLSYHAPIGYSGLGLGVNLMNDEIGPSKEIYLDANLSYTIETGEEGNLAFGLRLGGRLLNIDWSKGKVNQNEQILEENINKFLPTIGVGIYYYEPEWYVGLSVPNILRKEHYDAENPVGESAVERMHFFLIAGYVYDINEDLKLKPAALLKAVSGAPLSLDVSANLLFNEKFRIGLGWRWNDSLSALLGFQVSEELLIGYSYDLTTSNYNVTNSGTHEIMLQYELLRNTTFRSPRFF
ncbi:type IX secretion system membrane protein PorP/SprF [Tenacibaculum sp. AHE15PA]|uniref:PorP/SprF family type IX secretion system membrane protein n=1 Tax=unclassified Tenacibaculum TaxID=2635139 RepID=UPI001C4EDEC0|nr:MULTISPECIES: type IX secretion system membrane protein PorP/SprF [unclassified Tenacibaculum]QXP74202.1 type IX secretion system membrane protein PorP/SprF [Tenacibaculum sp. AHE14PA]QXP75430.1 type IX secretion system membrane protein PorP/SprF [Tenacibaculum sp. AHE15PA]